MTLKKRFLNFLYVVQSINLPQYLAFVTISSLRSNRFFIICTSVFNRSTLVSILIPAAVSNQGLCSENAIIKYFGPCFTYAT